MSALYMIGEKYLFPEQFPEELVTIWGKEWVNEEALLQDILRGGLLGASSEDRLHSANLTLSAMEDLKGGKRLPAFLRALFPSAQRLYKRYPWLRKAPFLLPAAWLHRMIIYGTDNVLHGREGHRATEAVRIGNERVRLMRRYHMLEKRKRKRRPEFLKHLCR